MYQRKRIYYSETQRSLMWDRWQRGESLQQIADLFDRHHSAIAGALNAATAARADSVCALARASEVCSSVRSAWSTSIRLSAPS